MVDSLKPDPSFIHGGVAKTPFVLQHDPFKLFDTRASRFRFLAQTSELAPYLEFLGDLTALQATLAQQLPAPTPVSDAQIAGSTQAGLPPIDRAALAEDAALHTCLQAFVDGASQTINMPAPARAALDMVRNADHAARSEMLSNVLGDEIPAERLAEHMFVACAVQIHLARLAASLPVERLQPVATGVCPACGGRPVTSSVIGLRDIENVRYANCGCCATQWNEVRIKCLCCGSTEGISYRSAETEDATVKAEVCKECSSWVKTLYQVRNASLEPVADDVGSMGLDILMQDTPFHRAGFNPFLMGY